MALALRSRQYFGPSRQLPISFPAANRKGNFQIVSMITEHFSQKYHFLKNGCGNMEIFPVNTVMEFSRRKLLSVVATVYFGVSRPVYVYNFAFTNHVKEGKPLHLCLLTVRSSIPTATTGTGHMLQTGCSFGTGGSNRGWRGAQELRAHTALADDSSLFPQTLIR